MGEDRAPSDIGKLRSVNPHDPKEGARCWVYLAASARISCASSVSP